MELKVAYQGGTRFDISAGRHMVVADQPVEDGGSDAGPSPIELFVASLGSCVAYFIVRYCHRHGIPADGFHLRARATFAEQPHRIGAVRLTLEFPTDIPAEHLERIRKVAHGCTVQRTLEHPPAIELEFACASQSVR